jgi:hypothetical protein
MTLVTTIFMKMKVSPFKKAILNLCIKEHIEKKVKRPQGLLLPEDHMKN